MAWVGLTKGPETGTYLTKGWKAFENSNYPGRAERFRQSDLTGKVSIMKTLILCLLLPFSALCQTTTVEEAPAFSRVFNIYTKRFRDIIVSYSTGSMLIANKRRFRVAGRNKDGIILIDHFVLSSGKDSVIQVKPFLCTSLFEALNLINDSLTTEEGIPPCIKRVRKYVGQDVVEEVEDLRNYDDLISWVLEYRLNGETRRISQLDPDMAKKICPQSTERMLFYRFIRDVNALGQ